jgi:hypothetical protein
VLGDGAQFALVARLAGVEEQLATSSVDALIRAGVLRADERAGFTHPLFAIAVYDDLSPFDRARDHERAASLLASVHAPADRVAAHLLLAPPRGERWVVDALSTAGRELLRKGAPDSAVTYLARAAAEPPHAEERADVLLALGTAEARVNGPDAAVHLRAAYGALSDRAARARVARLLARTLLFTGHPEEAVTVSREAAAELPSSSSELREELEAVELMAAYFGAGDLNALNRLRTYRMQPVGRSLGGKMLAALAAHEWAYSGGPSSPCVELALQALEDGALLAADVTLLGAVAISTLTLADREEAMEMWVRAQIEAHRRGSLDEKIAIGLWRGFSLARRGELADAHDSLAMAARELELWGFGAAVGPIHCALSQRAARPWRFRVARATLSPASMIRATARRALVTGVTAGSDCWSPAAGITTLWRSPPRWTSVLAICATQYKRPGAPPWRWHWTHWGGAMRRWRSSTRS